MDDKTTKIPSLKEFENSHKSNSRGRRAGVNKNKPAKNLKGDTHRVDLKREKSSEKYPADDTKTYKPKNSSGFSASTQKIDSRKIREQDESLNIKNERYDLNRFSSDSSQKLHQTRVAGRRPQSAERISTPQNSQRRPSQENSGQVRRRPAPQNATDRRRPAGSPDNNHPRSSRQPPLRHKKRKKPLSPLARKLRRILIYVLIALSIVVAGIVLSMTVLFKTENIVVNVPDNFYSAEDIISASGLHYQDNIFTSAKGQASEKLMEKFPYIKTADVYAVMPDTINIDITLCTPSYAVRTESLTYIASEDSKVLEVTATADEVDVPLIEGVSVKEGKTGTKLKFESEFVESSLSEIFSFAKTKGYKNITAVDIETNVTHSGTKTIEIRYVYDNRIVVYLGIPENLSYKMQTAHTIINDKLDVNGAVLKGELDVSQCYDTMKSYFNQYSLIPDVVVTEPPSGAAEATTEATEAPLEDEWYDDEYVEDEWVEDEWYEDEEEYIDDSDYDTYE